jgi:hypothetical protein
MRLIKLGDIVELLEPFNPSDAKDAFYRMHLHLPRTEKVKAYQTWRGFTHGIVVEIMSQGSDGDPHHVSLHLYDPQLGLLYMCNSELHAIPTYVDFHVSELKLYKVAEQTGYLEVQQNEL